MDQQYHSLFRQQLSISQILRVRGKNLSKLKDDIQTKATVDAQSELLCRFLDGTDSI